MELRHLRYFVAVAEEMSMRKAAERLHIAAPPLSVQMRNLQEEVGADLLARDGRGIRLTEAGRVFLGKARETLALAERSIMLAREAARGQAGHLSIGYNTPSEFLVLPSVIPEFRQEAPAIQLSFHSMKAPQQFDALRRGEIEIGFVWLPTPTDEFDVAELREERLYVALPERHPLSQDPVVSIAQLANEPMILASRRLAPETYHQIEQLFRDEGAIMNVVYELDSSLSLVNFVAMGAGCCIVPDYARSIRTQGIAYRPLGPVPTAKTLAMIRRRNADALTGTFFDFVTDWFARADRDQ